MFSMRSRKGIIERESRFASGLDGLGLGTGPPGEHSLSVGLLLLCDVAHVRGSFKPIKHKMSVMV